MLIECELLLHNIECFMLEYVVLHITFIDNEIHEQNVKIEFRNQHYRQ